MRFAAKHTVFGFLALLVAANASARAKLYLSVTENGVLAPAKLVIKGRYGTRDPNLGPPSRAAGALNVVMAAIGKASLKLDPGKYRIYALRGLEFDLAQADVVLKGSGTTSLTIPLIRAFATPGAIAADLHSHALPSKDSSIALADKIAQAVAEGVEVLVETDHNQVTDLNPALVQMGMQARLHVVAGAEVTTPASAYGHFNVYPIHPALPSPPWWSAPAGIFHSARLPQGERIIQVNHPRGGVFGTFTLLDLDPATGLSPDPAWDGAFDAVEILDNANTFQGHEVLADWFNLLDQGHTYTAVGNGDSHVMIGQELGWPRNYLLVDHDDPASFSDADLVQAVKRHKSFLTNGPYITLDVAGQATLGDLVTLPPGPTEIHVTVDAAAFVGLDAVELWGNSTMLASLTPGCCGTRRIDTTVTVDLERDTWIVAVARGPGYTPSIPQPLSKAATFAVTNPVWVDVDGVDADGDGSLFDAVHGPAPPG